MKTETNEKVLAMYEAVWTLIEEGCDVHKMKVSDITARAGIGKGTAYEYFRSKEELVAKALQYDFQLQYQLLAGEVEKQGTLRGAVGSCFAWLEKNTNRRRFAMQFLKMSRESREDQEGFGCSFDCMRRQMDGGMDMFRQILGFMVKLGRKEGIIGTEVPEKLARLEILTQLLGYFLYLQMGNPKGEEEVRQTKIFLYENIVKSL